MLLSGECPLAERIEAARNLSLTSSSVHQFLLEASNVDRVKRDGWGIFHPSITVELLKSKLNPSNNTDIDQICANLFLCLWYRGHVEWRGRAELEDLLETWATTCTNSQVLGEFLENLPLGAILGKRAPYFTRPSPNVALAVLCNVAASRSLQPFLGRILLEGAFLTPKHSLASYYKKSEAQFKLYKPAFKAVAKNPAATADTLATIYYWGGKSVRKAVRAHPNSY